METVVERKNTPRLNRRIKQIALNDRRISCRMISTLLASEGITISRKTVNNRIFEAGLRTHRPRKTPMKESRLNNVLKLYQFQSTIKSN